MSSFALQVLVVAALFASVVAQPYLSAGPCICKCAPGTGPAARFGPGYAIQCIDNPIIPQQQDCDAACNSYQSDCAARGGLNVFGVPAVNTGLSSDVSCAGGGSPSFPYSVTIYPFTSPPASPCVDAGSVRATLLQPAAVGSARFILGACRSITVGTDAYGVQLLGVSLSKNFVMLLYSDANCNANNFLFPVGKNTRNDCPGKQVAPPQTPDWIVTQSLSVYFAATVPGQTSSTSIACTCKCASFSSPVGRILGCNDVPASQCGGAYCATMYGASACTAPNYYLASPPPDPLSAMGVPCAGSSGYQLTSKFYKPYTPCVGNTVPSSSTQVGFSTTWSANQCSSTGTGYSQRFLGCSSSNYYVFQTFVGNTCDSNQFVSTIGGQAGCSYGFYPGYTAVYTCYSPAQLAAGIIAVIAIAAIIAVAAIFCCVRRACRGGGFGISYVSFGK